MSVTVSCFGLVAIGAGACGDGFGAEVNRSDALAEYGPGSRDPSGRRFASPPSFEDYSVDTIFDGKPAAPDFSSHPEAERFRGALLRAPSQVNFAGRYVLVSRSCGRLCREFALIDAVSGRVFPGLTDAPPFEFRIDSRLIAFEPPEPLPGRMPCAGCSAAYYVWNNERLELIPPETWIGSAPPPPGVGTLIDSLRVEEKPALDGRPAVLRPAWNRLVISARDGTRMILSDRTGPEGIERVYVYRGYLDAIDHHLVRVIESGLALDLIVDAASGVVTELDSPPILSPDAARFLTIASDAGKSESSKRIRVYRMTSSGPVIEWSQESSDWETARPVWVGPDRIHFDRQSVGKPGRIERSAASLDYGLTGWKISPR